VRLRLENAHATVEASRRVRMNEEDAKRRTAGMGAEPEGKGDYRQGPPRPPTHPEAMNQVAAPPSTLARGPGTLGWPQGAKPTRKAVALPTHITLLAALLSIPRTLLSGKARDGRPGSVAAIEFSKCGAVGKVAQWAGGSLLWTRRLIHGTRKRPGPRGNPAPVGAKDRDASSGGDLRRPRSSTMLVELGS
jgi:hypothetical protein